MISKKIKFSFILFALVILSVSIISASNAVDTQILNDTNVDLNQNDVILSVEDTSLLNDVNVNLNKNNTVRDVDNTSHLSNANVDLNKNGSARDANNDITQKELSQNTTSDIISKINISSNIPNNNSFYHSLELSFVKNLVDNYGNFNIDELASIYNINPNCIKNTLQLVRAGVYGSDLKNILEHSDYVLNQQIISLKSCKIDFSKIKNKRGSNFKADIARKILQHYGQYNVRNIAYQLSKENITISESDI